MKIKSKRIISAFLVISTLFGGMPNLSSMAATKNRDPYGVIDNNNPINNGYDFLMQSDEPLKIRKKLLGDNISISNMVGVYGSLQDNGDYFIYNLSDFLNGIEEFNITVNGKDEVVRIIPAPEMVYDDDFVGIDYSEGWKIDESTGYYGRTIHYSDGSATVDSTIQFKGEALQVWSVTDADTGMLNYKVYKKGDDGEFSIRETNRNLDTKSKFNHPSYNQKIIQLKFTDSELDRKMTILFAAGTSKIYLDRFVLYNPIGVNLNSSIALLYDKYRQAQTVEYINVYYDNNFDEFAFLEKSLFTSPYSDTLTPENIIGRIVFDRLDGEYGSLTYDTTPGGINTQYNYKLNGWLAGIDEFDITIDGVSKVLRIIPLEHMDFIKKNVSSNLDVYIKSENMLSLSLDTNSVTFENYSGAEPIEKLGAINLTINSSLPYNLNAYMPSGITNSDGSKIMPIDIFNIRESNNGNYQTFASIGDKVVLKEGCVKGNNINHSIDLKLDSNDAHVADIYKTVIKFEAEQK